MLSTVVNNTVKSEQLTWEIALDNENSYPQDLYQYSGIMHIYVCVSEK